LSQAKNKVFYNTKGPAYFSSSSTYNPFKIKGPLCPALIAVATPQTLNPYYYVPSLQKLQFLKLPQSEPI
jgi:hypothetical protein